MCSISLNWIDEKEPIKIKISTSEEKNTKIKLQMNEHEISFHENSKSELQIVQPEKSCKSYEKAFF